jgi:hypothetical protein
MLSPEQFREQVLPYLYDVLDEEERRVFEATLQSSPEARVTLEHAKAKQQMLAAAVRNHFPDVTFAAPPLPTRNSNRLDEYQPRRRPERSSGRWLPWAVAATLVVGVLGGGGYWSVTGWAGYKRQLVEASERFNKAGATVNQLMQKIKEEQLSAEKDIRAIEQQVTLLVNDWNREADVQKKIFRQKGVQVVIQSPRALQAGATNSIQIDMKRNEQLPMPGGQDLPELNARVIDQSSNQVLFQKVLDTKNGQTQFNFDLPRDIPVKPKMDLALEIFSDKNKNAPIEVREHLTLAAPEYVTHLYTDRPMYRPGETVHFRSLTLDRFNLKPAQEDLRLRFHITDPNNGVVPGSQVEGVARIAADANGPPLMGPDAQPLRGIGAGEFHIPPGLAGGQYMLHVAEASGRFPPERRRFIIHQWQAPRINKEITFDRSSYGPGDPIEITALGIPVEGGGPERKLTAAMKLTVDGHIISEAQQNVDADGRVRYPAIKLPEQMANGSGSVSVTFADGGNRETIVRPIPIVLDKLVVAFYPEGGDVVGGLLNRVYFQASTSIGKPADVQGRIVDQTGTVLAKVHTLTDSEEPGVNQGMGVFSFTPQVDATYELKIDSPTGMHGKDGKMRYVLPAAKAEGVVLRLPQGVVQDAIDVEITSADRDRQLLVGAYCRGKLLDSLNVDAKTGQTTRATLRPTLDVGGVYRVTAFEKTAGHILPIAERLIYRHMHAKLNLAIAADKPVHNPGDPVRLSLEASNEKKDAAPSVCLVSVVDLSVFKLANDRTTRALPTHFLLTSEVRQPEDLENADFFLGNHPKAGEALDLLLGVQGWRRFAEQDPVRFTKQQNHDASRILQVTGPGGMQTNDPEKEVLAQVDAKFAPKYVELEKKWAEREKVQAGDPDTVQRLTAERERVQEAQQLITNAQNNLNAYERFLIRLGLGTLVIGALVTGLMLLYVGVRRLSRGRTAAPFFMAGASVLLLLFMGSLAGTFSLMGGRGIEHLQADRWGGRPAPMPAPPAMAPMAVKVDDGNVAADLGVAQDQFQLGEGVPRGIGPADVKDINALALRDPMLGLAPAPVEPNVPAGGEPVAFGRIADPARPQGLPNLLRARRAGINIDERRLRRQGNFKELLRQRLNREVNVLASVDPFIVREYAHTRQPNPGNVRGDFAETLFWHPALVLNDGKGEVSFDLSDAATRFQVVVFGHTLDGRLGATAFEIVSRLPVSIEPKVPIEVTSSDTITLPVTIANDRNEPATATLAVQHKNLTMLPDPLRAANGNIQLSVERNKRVRELFVVRPAVKEGPAAFRVSGDFGALGKDAVERTFNIVPEGFPVVGAQSGLLEKWASHQVTLPDNWVDGTLKCQVQVFPSTLAELQKGLEGLLREPCGCFEQSSTSNYPNVLILNYLKEADLSKPDVEKRARLLLASGYARLTSFECTDPNDPARREGYEWFGQTAPPHEALTAYGLLQFKDMSKVYTVDEDMLRRTQKYLLGQRDGMGSFERNPRAIDSFGRAPEHITNAYIVWALTESGVGEDLTRELAALFDKAKDSNDPYFVALAGISQVNQHKAEEGIELLTKLVKHQNDDGHVDGAKTSITGSGGRDLVVETTALATLGWLKANRPDLYAINIDKAAQWLGKQRGSAGAFGSTQSTILALKALIARAHAHKRPIQPGEIRLFFGERQVAARSFQANIQESITLAVPDHDYLKPGVNPIRIQLTGNNEFPYTLSWSYQTLKPANSKNCPVNLTARLRATDVKEGDTVRLTATVENKSGQGQGMTVAIIGLPGGLALPEDFAQLKDMAARKENGTKPGLISAWELRGRELVLYWRDMAPNAKIDVNLDLVCRLPGIYSGPASRAYLYYNADNKFWCEPLGITIHPPGEER